MIIAGFGLHDRHGSPLTCLPLGRPFHTRAGHSHFSPTLNESSYASFPGSCFLRARQVSQPAEGAGGQRDPQPWERAGHPRPAQPTPTRTRARPRRALFLCTARFHAERQINPRARPCPCVRGPAVCVTRKRAPGPPPPPPPPNPQQGAEPEAAAAARLPPPPATPARPSAPAQARPRLR